MKSFSLVCLLVTAAPIPAVAQNADPFTGRWDLLVTPKAANAKAYPGWMEVGVKDSAPALRIQPRGGGTYYAKQFKVEGAHLSAQTNGAKRKNTHTAAPAANPRPGYLDRSSDTMPF